MSELAADDQPAFIINLGDNFYMNGVKNINDERFQVKGKINKFLRKKNFRKHLKMFMKKKHLVFLGFQFLVITIIMEIYKLKLIIQIGVLDGFKNKN